MIFFVQTVFPPAWRHSLREQMPAVQIPTYPFSVPLRGVHVEPSGAGPVEHLLPSQVAILHNVVGCLHMGGSQTEAANMQRETSLLAKSVHVHGILSMARPDFMAPY